MALLQCRAILAILLWVNAELTQFCHKIPGTNNMTSLQPAFSVNFVYIGERIIIKCEEYDFGNLPTPVKSFTVILHAPVPIEWLKQVSLFQTGLALSQET